MAKVMTNLILLYREIFELKFPHIIRFGHNISIIADTWKLSKKFK